MPVPRRVADLPPAHLRNVIAEYEDGRGDRHVLFALRYENGAVVYFLHHVDDVQASQLGDMEVIDWCVDHGKAIPEELRRHASPRDLDLIANAPNPPAPPARRTAARRPTTARRRRRKAERKPRPLTPEQLEAIQLVAEHKGNVAAAARAAGKSRAAMKKLYDKASKKLGRKAIEHCTQSLPHDRRGQVNIEGDE
jgi:hypothetical protein